VSRKGKKKSKGRFRPPVRPGVAPGTGAAAAPTTVAASAARSVSQARVGGDQALVRAVEMSLGGRSPMVKGKAGRFVAESADPSIPLDRVPYFTKDLVRLAVVGAAMVVLLGVGSFTVPLIVK